MAIVLHKQKSINHIPKICIGVHFKRYFTEELSDFQRGTIIGCHLSNKSVRQISALLELPRSTVSAVVVKWKRQGATTAQLRSGTARKKHLSSVATLTSEFQSASGSNVSTITDSWELHEMGFHG